MKTYRIYPERLVFCLFLCMIFLISSCKQPDPFPPICIPGIPKDGEYCLWRINKSTDGKISVERYAAYSCNTGNTERSTAELNLRVFSLNAPGCDETIPPFPENTTVLSAKGHAIHREGGLAYFVGTFQINNLANEKEELLFEGTMELMAKVESHQIFGAAECQHQCDQEKHMEGWLVGKGVGNLSKYIIRAVFATGINEDIPVGMNSFNTLFQVNGRIAGVVVQAL